MTVDDLIDMFAKRLELDGDFMVFFDPAETEMIALARSAARRAGRRLGCKVRTVQTDAEARADGKVIVLAYLETYLSPAHEERHLKCPRGARERYALEAVFAAKP